MGRETGFPVPCGCKTRNVETAPFVLFQQSNEVVVFLDAPQAVQSKDKKMHQNHSNSLYIPFLDPIGSMYMVYLDPFTIKKHSRM